MPCLIPDNYCLKTLSHLKFGDVIIGQPSITVGTVSITKTCSFNYCFWRKSKYYIEYFDDNDDDDEFIFIIFHFYKIKIRITKENLL